jgi:hypothetical protein
MPCLSHHPWLDHSNYAWRRAQVMKFHNDIDKSDACNIFFYRRKILWQWFASGLSCALWLL